MKKKWLIFLASASPRRRAILKKWGFRYTIKRPGYCELNSIHRAPSMLVRAHALGKALSVSPKIRQGWILGADTIVWFQGQVIGKPQSMSEAFRILGRLQGQWHTVYTGVALLAVDGGKIRKRTVFYEKTRIALKGMTRAEQEFYFKKVNPLDKAGAYAIQSKSVSIVRQVHGSVWNAAGLPIETLSARLRRGGYCF